MTPDQAKAVVEDLGDAFATGDVEAVIERFADEGEVTYAGSEQGEVAVGLPALRLLLAELFSRDERYSWACDSVRVTPCAAGFAVLADATLFVDAWPRRVTRPPRESFPYRVSGLLEAAGDTWRWRVCQGTEPT